MDIRVFRRPPPAIFSRAGEVWGRWQPPQLECAEPPASHHIFIVFFCFRRLFVFLDAVFCLVSDVFVLLKNIFCPEMSVPRANFLFFFSDMYIIPFCIHVVQAPVGTGHGSCRPIWDNRIHACVYSVCLCACTFYWRISLQDR